MRSRSNSDVSIQMSDEGAFHVKHRDEIAPETAWKHIMHLTKVLDALIASAGASRQLAEEASVYGIAAVEFIACFFALIVWGAELYDRIFEPGSREDHSAAKSAIYFLFKLGIIALSASGAALLIAGLHVNGPTHNHIPHIPTGGLQDLTPGNNTTFFQIAGSNLNFLSIIGVMMMGASKSLANSVEEKPPRRPKKMFWTRTQPPIEEKIEEIGLAPGMSI